MRAILNPKRIRDVVFIAHRYIGLAVGILAAVIGLTGSLLIIHGWTSSPFSQKVAVSPNEQPVAIAALVSQAQSRFPNLTLQSLEMPKTLSEPIKAWWVDAAEHYTAASINPYTGAIIGTPDPSGDRYSSFLYDIHINLLGGEWGAYVAGVVGLLATILCVTGIVLWPGWRKLALGFKIKWNAQIKRLNFDLHKVAGIIAAVFLAMAMGTGFIWNFSPWINPVIYALTFSPQPVAEPTSKVIANQPPAGISTLIQSASAALPAGEIRAIYFPTQPEGVIQVNKTINAKDFSISLDQFSGKVLKIDDPTQKSLGDRLLESFGPFHFGTFAGTASRIFYVFVGLSPSLLLITGFMMWRYRRRTPKSKHESIAKSIP
ncbi:MAG: PepSY domain-containing protein [Aphanocapsa sp. GSE-SYN-MK-11-07L]|jgi:uncharacterized iron-regulated membrane protein|nr:PepSY domain-containing protein [Aphanocapsa sp. GSE-SYN-MK-11-07L]